MHFWLPRLIIFRADARRGNEAAPGSEGRRDGEGESERDKREEDIGNAGQISGDLSRSLDIIRAECRVSHEFRKKLAGERKVSRSSECAFNRFNAPSRSSLEPCSSPPPPSALRRTALRRRTSMESRGIRAVGTCAGSRKVFQIGRGRGSLPLEV